MTPHDQGIIAIVAVAGLSFGIALFVITLEISRRVSRIEKKLRKHGIFIS